MMSQRTQKTKKGKKKQILNDTERWTSALYLHRYKKLLTVNEYTNIDSMHKLN